MALSLSLDFPSVEVVDQTRIKPSATPYGVCIMLGSGTTTSNDKVPTLINDLTDFSAKIGDASASKKYVEAFFANSSDTGIRLYFLKVSTGSTPATITDYVTAVEKIPFNFNVGGIIIAPEFFETNTTAGEITQLGNALDKFCDTEEDSYWISIVDLPIATATITEAVTAKNRFTSTKGNLITYQPYYLKDEVKLLPSAAMAAICLNAWKGNQFNTVPAGLEYEIKGATALGYTLTKTDLATAHANGINAIRYFPAYGFVAYDTITISTNPGYFQINSVVCFKIVVYLVERELLGYIHSSISGDVEVMTEIEAALSRILNSAWESGYLAGTNQNDAFTVKGKLEPLPPPNVAILIFEAEVRPAYALQKIKIFLRNKLGD